ncbi:hypothetical protein CDL15_Pgr007882 [Punica granatum]|uniref:Protein kinase domain-containing protein n=2 Tax=Punica granatum TaxID=22663 RepID=A0A218XA86_PUNGR|nr:hypothetical protein CDL15_Pgr007882 [Punica granatum]
MVEQIGALTGEAYNAIYLSLQHFYPTTDMAEQIGASPPVTPFNYELVEGDPDNLKTVDATPVQLGPWIDPAMLKLKHRIGRGPFGDVWLATHHQSADDFDEYHEVAVKMLHPLKEENMQLLLEKFEDLFFKCRKLPGLCIAMKFYEGSLGDQLARLKGGKLQLAEILRYGAEIARAILELHSIGVLVLNLKPSNLLLDQHNQVSLGDFGIPYLLFGIPLSDPDMILRLGTPNYMAPEQWEPEIRGPISYETDSWGFGCSIVELLSGIQPWCGRSNEEIYHSVVIKQEYPPIPSGLPPAIENVIRGCFEYDLRNRPSMKDILQAFESSKNAVYTDGEWVGLGSRSFTQRPSSGCTPWFLLKDHIQVGDAVHSRRPLNARRPRNIDVPEGSVVGLQNDSGREGFALVKIPGVPHPLKVQIFNLERVTFGFAAGDWVRLKEASGNHSSLGVLHSILRDGSVTVGFVGLPTLWRGHSSEIQMAEALYVGQFVRVKEDVLSPRFAWPRKSRGIWATGRISQVLPNGCLLVSFPGRFVFGDEPNSFLADPAEVQLVLFSTCPGVGKKYEHVEDFHWAVRPLVVAFGLFTAMKIGFSVQKSLCSRLKKGQKNSMRGGGQNQDSQSGGNNAAWLPPPVANMIFRDGANAATAR